MEDAYFPTGETCGPQNLTITYLLERWNVGEQQAARELLPLVYDKLRDLAGQLFRRERPDHTLQATALVHEVYLELISKIDPKWKDRLHFYSVAACMMRRALIDYSRRHSSAKRGGDTETVSLNDAVEVGRVRSRALIALDDALNDLTRLDPQKALIVELRFFGGFTVDQTAECLGLSPRSVARQWQLAKAVLYSDLSTEMRDAL